MSKQKIGIHSRIPIPVSWLEEHIRAHGKCPHVDSTLDVVEVCYGDSTWEMEKFFALIGKFQKTLMDVGIPLEKTYILIDVKRYKVPMLIIQN